MKLHYNANKFQLDQLYNGHKWTITKRNCLTIIQAKFELYPNLMQTAHKSQKVWYRQIKKNIYN